MLRSFCKTIPSYTSKHMTWQYTLASTDTQRTPASPPHPVTYTRSYFKKNLLSSSFADNLQVMTCNIQKVRSVITIGGMRRTKEPNLQCWRQENSGDTNYIVTWWKRKSHTHTIVITFTTHGRTLLSRIWPLTWKRLSNSSVTSCCCYCHCWWQSWWLLLTLLWLLPGGKDWWFLQRLSSTFTRSRAVRVTWNFRSLFVCLFYSWLTNDF